MPLLSLPLELLLTIAHYIRDDYGELCYGDLYSVLRAHSALYLSLNRMLWKEAAEHEAGTQRVLTYLIQEKDFARLNFFLELGPDVEVLLPTFNITGFDDDFDPTPLLIAADTNNIPLARLLLDFGAEVQYSDGVSGEFSPMHAARSPEMVQLLLDYRADLNFMDDVGYGPLHWYAIRNDVAAMRAILQHGAEVNPIWTSEKPLHEAAQRNVETVELLVQHGADVKALNFRLNTPLHLAAAFGKIDVMRFLLERWPEGTRVGNDLGRTPLHVAAESRVGNIDAARLLVEQWPEGMKQRDIFSNTPLHVAANYDRGGQVVELLVQGWPAGIRERNRFGDTPLHMAWTGEVVRFLQRWSSTMGR
jgi:ankyrin repeat protein